MSRPRGAVGRNVLRKEGADKATGRAKYVDDLTFPDLLYARTVRSTIPAPPPVSPRMEQARRGPGNRPSVVPALSPDDADQLARAVVAIARIDRLDEAPLDAEPSPTPLVRLATADPDVVIYWQLEPSGGE